MSDSEVDEEDLARIPRLAHGCDPTSLNISPAEGFLLSRIDAQTSWKLLREIGGLSSDEVDICIEDWLAQGIIDIDGRPPRVKRSPNAVKPARRNEIPLTPGKIDESLICDDLGIGHEIQRSILMFEQELGSDDFSLLGVGRDASSKEIKRAYFGLSKQFHPDLYFRQEIGHFEERLGRIFKRISEAHELLSDPAGRKDVGKSGDAAKQGAPPSPGSGTDGKRAEGYGQQRPLTPIERLRRRMPLRVSEEARSEKKEKGAELFKAARVAQKMGRLEEAESSLRLAVVFDPSNEEYERAFSELKGEQSIARMDELLAVSDACWSESDRREAEQVCEAVLLHRPDDPETHDRAARLYLAIGNKERAAECVGRAIESDPQASGFRRTLAMVHKAKGLWGHAISELERVLEADSEDSEARNLILQLKTGSRQKAANGGKQ